MARADMTDGCPERFDWEFLCYIWSFNQTMRPQLEEALQNFSELLFAYGVPVIIETQ